MKQKILSLFLVLPLLLYGFPVSASTAHRMIVVYTDDLLTALIVGFILSLVIAFLFKARLKTARRQSFARNYIRQGSFRLRRKQDMYLYSNTTRTRVRDSRK